MGPTLVMARTFLKIFAKDKQAIFLMLFFPIMIMASVGVAGSSDEDPIKIGVVDNGANAFSADLISALSSNPLFDVTVDVEDALKAEVEKGELSLVLVLPKELTSKDHPATLTMLVDATDVRETATLRPLIEQTLLDIEREMRGTNPLFPLAVVDVQARSRRYIDFLVPGLLALAVMHIGVAGSGHNVVDYRRKGVLKRLFVTPIRPSHFIGGIVLAWLVITVTQVAALLGIAVVVLDVRVAGSVLELLLLIISGSSIFLSLGFAIGSIAKTVHAMRLLGNLFTLPQMFLSGVFFSIDSMPDMLQHVAKLLPLTFLASGMRDVAYNGLSLQEQIPTIVGFAVWLVASLLLAIGLFRWKEFAT